jgi:hypothetical protein
MNSLPKKSSGIASSRMLALKRMFLRRSLDELEVLSAEISRGKDRSEEKCMELARPVLHRIHGTGASLGMLDLGQKAGELRAQLRAAPMPKALLLQSVRAISVLLRDMVERT